MSGRIKKVASWMEANTSWICCEDCQNDKTDLDNIYIIRVDRGDYNFEKKKELYCGGKYY